MNRINSAAKKRAPKDKAKLPRAPKGFYLNDYDFHGYEHLGIFFYGDRVLFGHEKNLGVRSYHFKLELTNTSIISQSLNPQHKKIAEKIQFTFTCDLQKFTSNGSRFCPESIGRNDACRIGNKKSFDLEKLLLVAAPKQYKQAVSRIRRRLKGAIPNPTPYTGKNHTHYKGMEFLEFTNESAPSWAGPFQQGKKLGACAKVDKRQGEPKFTIEDVRGNWKYWSLPFHTRAALDTKAKGTKHPNGDYLTSEWSQEEKEAFFDSLDLNTKLEISQAYYKSHISYLKEQLPFRVYITGNDDCSYTKWFATKDEAEAELNRLRMMQPLDMQLDIIDQQYTFTN